MYLWPSTSPNRLLEFQEQLEHNALVREEMGNRVKLKTLCESRWAYGVDCLSVFVTAYQVIVETLHVVSEIGDITTRDLEASITKWDFIIAVVTL